MARCQAVLMDCFVWVWLMFGELIGSWSIRVGRALWGGLLGMLSGGGRGSWINGEPDQGVLP